LIIIDGCFQHAAAKMEPVSETYCAWESGNWYFPARFPPHAACSESVELAKAVSNKGAAGMVNGILRRIASHPPDMSSWDFAMRHALPAWLSNRLQQWYGSEVAESIALASNEPPRLTRRVNRHRCAKSALEQSLSEEGVVCRAPAFHPDALEVDLAGHPLDSLQAFSAGWFMAQDEAAMLVSTVADPKPEQKVLDVCAAPGGKTCHIAELTGDTARILACDLHPARLRLVDENARRLGLSGIRTCISDATEPPAGPSSAERMDLVLCDVPCSGLGLLARKPEIRLIPDPGDWASLIGIQRAILSAAAERVKPGGTLLYSTCTINPDENVRQADWFLNSQAGKFRMDGFADRLPAGLASLDPSLVRQASEGRIQLLPGKHPCDGFFIARFRRNA
jgi:16S rRNA (cytosine967-C5)-methyltransferase